MKYAKWILALVFLAGTSVSYAQEESWEEESWEEESWEEESWEETEESETFSDPFGEETEEPESPKVNFTNACENRDELRNSTKKQLLPYKYCNSKTTTLTFRKFPQKHEVVVPVYYKQEHLLVFNTEGLGQDILIKVYDKPSSSKKREMLFENVKGETISLFELPKDYKGSKLFVDYIIPAIEGEKNVTSKGCVIFMMGYLDEKFMDLKAESTAK